ncbi:olfactory receptor 6K3-like, partial [Scleropages formosus]
TNNTVGHTPMVTLFILSAFYEIDDMKYLSAAIFLFLYLFIIITNVTLIAVIYVERVLHNPITTSLLPGTDLLFAHDAIVEFIILAVMGYERLLAICHPLQYRKDPAAVNIDGLLSVVVYSVPQLCVTFYSYTHVLGIRILSLRESKMKALKKHKELHQPMDLLLCNLCEQAVWPPCKVHNTVMVPCCRFTAPMGDSPKLLFNAMLTCLCWSMGSLVLYTDVEILATCRKSQQGKSKCVQTCASHLISFLNDVTVTLFDRFSSTFTSLRLKSFISLHG